jgi:hypothetical protein
VDNPRFVLDSLRLNGSAWRNAGTAGGLLGISEADAKWRLQGDFLVSLAVAVAVSL